MPTSQYQRARIRALRDRLTDIKLASGGCTICGFTDPRALVLVHRNPSQKRFAVTTSQYARSPADIDEEIPKCDVYCKNCHAIYMQTGAWPDLKRDHVTNGRSIRPVPKPR